MKKTIPIISILLISAMVYSNSPDTINHEVSKDRQEWFDEGDWHRGIRASPDASVDIKALYEHYSIHEGLWEKVFDYMRKTNLAKLETGRYALAGDSLFVIVDEYITEDVEQRNYEAHRKYIDLQYIISGKELIGVAKLDQLKVIEPYNAEKDIAFYRNTESEYRLADNSVFFIFFPDDAHQPCVKIDQPGPVKKIVFKILSFQ